ncbi:MAG: site-2 protease family protein [Candidatus Zixiibacteriota bacterium]|nr:MAG: site-2 protease family protein [candidate division Zixibacteria bacterium]
MKQDKHILTITRLLEDLFEIVAVYQRGQNLEFSLEYRFSRETSRTLISDRLSAAGYDFIIDDSQEQLNLKISPRPKIKIPRLNLILFVITLVSVYVVPVFFRELWAITLKLAEQSPDAVLVQSWWQEFKATMAVWSQALDNTLDALAAGAGIEFTLAMISILFVHEMGHFLASRRRNIVTSWPYFIPAPNFIGTFGAIIKSKSPFWNRRDLIEVGAAGPIAGWFVALIWLWYGLSGSVFKPMEEVMLYDRFYLFGESILMRLSTLGLVGAAPEGYAYKLTEAAFAGWVGLLITAINLLPIGQLDGGHILYGLGRKRQHLLGYIAMAFLIVLGFQSVIWWVFAAFGIIFGVKHPPTLNDSKKPGRNATGLGIIALIILVISFTPRPF